MVERHGASIADPGAGRTRHRDAPPAHPERLGRAGIRWSTTRESVAARIDLGEPVSF
jgi:hypothetical protein